MELDDLLKEEGLDAAGVEDALAWARRRAAELVRDVGGDPELGPLLDGARVVATDVEGARVGGPIVVHAPVEPPGPEADREPEREPEPRVVDASPIAAAHDEGPQAEDVRAPAEAEAHAPRPAEQDGARPRVDSGTVRASSRAGTSQSRPMFADLRGLQAAFLAESEDEDDELPEVGAVLRAFQKGKVRSGSVRSASGSMRAAATTPVDAVEAGPAPTSGPHDKAATVERRAREPDAPVPRRRAAHDGTPHRASAELVAAVHEPPSETDARRESEVTVPGASQPDATDDEAVASDAADHGLPAPPEADLDPLAGIDFDDLPGVDEDDEEEDHTHVDLPMPNLAAAAADDQELEARTTMVPMDGPDLTLPSMQLPLAELVRSRAEGAPGELTERALNPLLTAEPTGEGTVTAMTPNPLGEAAPAATEASDVTAPTPVDDEPAEEPAEDIELLDDEDLLLVDEEPQDDDEDVPEWKRALLESKSDDEPD